MKLISQTVLTFALSTALTGVSAAPVQLDESHTKVEFSVSHLVVSTLTGRFRLFSGAADFDPKTRVISNVRVAIKAASIDTGNEKRDGHLRSADFLEVKGNPEIVFVSTAAIQLRKGKAIKLPGKITIRGVTKPLILRFTYLGSAKSPFGPITVHAFNAEGSINREAFGITWNKAMEAGGVLVGKVVSLSIVGEVQ